MQHLLGNSVKFTRESCNFLLDISPVGKASLVGKRVYFSRETCVKFTRETLPSETRNNIDLLGKSVKFARKKNRTPMD